MKSFVVVAALIAVAAAVPNSYNNYGSGSYQSIPMQPAGSPPVYEVPNNSYGKSYTYTAPGATYQAPPITYAAPMLTFNPPSINYNGQAVTYATSAQQGYNGGGGYNMPQTQSYQPSGGYNMQQPQMQSYQPSGGY